MSQENVEIVRRGTRLLRIEVLAVRDLGMDVIVGVRIRGHGADSAAPFDQRVWAGNEWRNGKLVWCSDPGELIAYAYCDKGEPGLKKKSASAIAEPEATSSATAKCKKGSVAVAGGHASDDPMPGFFPLSSMRDGKRKWTVEVYDFTLVPADLNAFAYCDKSEPKLKKKSAETPVAADQAGSTTTCKQGTQVVSGGFDGPDADPAAAIGAAIYPYESKRTGKREWTASGWNDEEDGTFVAYAYCKKKKG